MGSSAPFACKDRIGMSKPTVELHNHIFLRSDSLQKNAA